MSGPRRRTDLPTLLLALIMVGGSVGALYFMSWAPGRMAACILAILIALCVLGFVHDA